MPLSTQQFKTEMKGHEARIEAMLCEHKGQMKRYIQDEVGDVLRQVLTENQGISIPALEPKTVNLASYAEMKEEIARFKDDYAKRAKQPNGSSNEIYVHANNIARLWNELTAVVMATDRNCPDESYKFKTIRGALKHYWQQADKEDNDA